MFFRILDGPIGVEIIAAGSAIRGLPRLRKLYGAGRWRKLKGIAQVELPDGCVCTAELHLYEAHGIGRREVRIKRLLE